MFAKLLSIIIESPHAKNAYLKLQKYYEERNKSHEAEALAHLIQKKFHGDDSNTNPQ